MSPSPSKKLRTLLSVGMLLLTGCGPTTVSQKLIGKWEGRPDTFAALRAREPIPTAPGYKEEPEPPAKSVARMKEASRIKELQPSEQTDLEAFDFVVSFDFMPQSLVTMRLNGQEEINGTWEIVSTDVGVSLIEITNGVPPSDDEEPDATSDIIKRRFSLKLNEQGDGFTLREEGVDPRFGWLYFERAE